MPAVYEEFLRKFEALPDIQIFLHLRNLSRPHIPDEERFSITRTSLPNCYRVLVRLGYNDTIITEGLGEVVYTEVRKHILTTPVRARASALDADAGGKKGAEGIDAEPMLKVASGSRDDRTATRLAALDAAYEAQTVYVSFHLCCFLSPCKFFDNESVMLMVSFLHLDCWKGTTSAR